jgi:hypothetical protein
LQQPVVDLLGVLELLAGGVVVGRCARRVVLEQSAVRRADLAVVEGRVAGDAVQPRAEAARLPERADPGQGADPGLL